MLGGGEVQRLWATVGADVTEYLKKMDQVEKRGQQTGQIVEKALGFIGLSLGAYGVKQLAGMTIELARAGAESERLAHGFEALAGADADRMLDGLRQASRGAASDMALMQAANKAMLLQVTSNTDDLVRLMEVARARGQAMGLSTQQAFSDIVTGIGRMSPMILDNLGILTGGQAGFEAYAQSIGKAAEALTDAEKRQYLLNKVINDSTVATLEAAGAQEDSATKLERVAAGWDNLRAATGRGIAEGGMADIAGWIGEQLNRIAEATESATEARRGLADFGAEIGRLRVSGTASNEVLAAMQGEYNRLANWQTYASLTAEQFREAMDEFKAANPGYVAALEAEAEAARQLALAMDWSAEEARALSRDLRNIPPGALPMPGEAQQGAMGLGRSILQQRQRRAGQAWMEDQEELRRQSEEAQSRWESQQRQWESQMRSTVEGLLSPTGVTDLDMARTRLGTYTDQWDEYIRRIRSAATDADSAWRHLIPTDVLAQGADAVRVWAAETEQAFYAGQLPEAINWEAFDRRLQEELARQQSRERLIQEAMRRAGGMASKEQISTALGLPLTPSEALSMDLSGIGDKVQLGKPITDAFEKQLAAESKRWEELGATAILWFSKGAQEGVTPATGRAIARGLFPYFAELLPEERP